MRKGQKKRVWTPEQKAEIVHKHLRSSATTKTAQKSTKMRRFCGSRTHKKIILKTRIKMVY